uniref:Vacuolar sorting protein 39/Transforming growth factor beta receptor-associated zinc finger domain-containing protein n=1 Tax=Romanomermis culicivorax TaxID=13658 RepID=A0A915JPQ1_ROMCU
MRRKLLNYLQLSSRFNAEAVLVELPDDVMHEERAILLEKAGRHYEAISVYTNILHDYKKAENYCLRYYQIEQKSDNRISTEETPNLFLCMLYSYVRPNEKKIGNLVLKNRLPNPRLALKVLQDYASKIDVPQAIELLPDDIKLSDLWISIRNVLRAITRKKDELQLRQSLLLSSLLMVETCKMNAQRTKINMTYDTDCSICKKRIGLSAFVYQTNKTIAHYYCLPSK